MKYSEHLYDYEGACRCGCGLDILRYEVVERFENGREVISHYLKQDKPHKVTSGVRCVEHNDAVGGSPNSKHLYGLALDILCPKGIEFLDWVLLWDSVAHDGGFGVYPYWRPRGGIHIDTWQDPPRRRWYQRVDLVVVHGQYPPLLAYIGNGGPGIV